MSFLTASCGNENHEDANQSQLKLEHNKLLVQVYFNEVWNKGRIELLDSILSTNYINHTPSVKDADKGIAGLKPIILAIRKGIPDVHYDIQDLIVTENRVVARVIMKGTHSDTLFDLPPTEKHIEVNQINIEEIKDGKISEHWRVTDDLELMRQVGVTGR